MRPIDADALIEFCAERWIPLNIDAVNMQPTIQPERKKGKWIEISSINHTYKCSECGRPLVNVADGRNNVSKHYPYCHCGADMRGERQK
jgi:DNA-directed RNA polymerase subunit RPC12/RpoP